MTSILATAVSLLPHPNAELVPLLRIPAEEIAELRADPERAGLMLRHCIAHALRTTLPDDPAAQAIAGVVLDAAQADAQRGLGELMAEVIAEGVGPQEMERRMREYFARVIGPEAVEHNLFGEQK